MVWMILVNAWKQHAGQQWVIDGCIIAAAE